MIRVLFLRKICLSKIYGGGPRTLGQGTLRCGYEVKINFIHSTDAQKTMDLCLSEISRVIKSKNGRFLSLTFAQPHFRTPFISKPKYSWGVEYQTFGTGFHYFCYVMTKGRSELQDQVTVSSAVDISRFDLILKFIEGDRKKRRRIEFIAPSV